MSDTPRTDSCPYCGSKTWEEDTGFRCGSDYIAPEGEDCTLYRTSTCYANENSQLKAEVEELATKYYDMEAACADHMAEVERLRDAFSHLTDEIECASKCSSHTTNYCDCGRLARAYAISDSIPQNPTK